LGAREETALAETALADFGERAGACKSQWTSMRGFTPDTHGNAFYRHFEVLPDHRCASNIHHSRYRTWCDAILIRSLGRNRPKPQMSQLHIAMAIVFYMCYGFIHVLLSFDGPAHRLVCTVIYVLRCVFCCCLLNSYFIVYAIVGPVHRLVSMVVYSSFSCNCVYSSFCCLFIVQLLLCLLTALSSVHRLLVYLSAWFAGRLFVLRVLGRGPAVSCLCLHVSFGCLSRLFVLCALCLHFSI